MPRIQEEIIVAIRRIVRAIELYSRELMAECGLTGPQLAALHEIARVEAINARELSDLLQVSEATMAGIVERLERGKYIDRHRGEDRRTMAIRITSEGRQALASAPPLLQLDFINNLSTLKDWEQTLLLSSLQRIAEMMAASSLEAAPHLVPGADRL